MHAKADQFRTNHASQQIEHQDPERVDKVLPGAISLLLLIILQAHSSPTNLVLKLIRPASLKEA